MSVIDMVGLAATVVVSMGTYIAVRLMWRDK